MSLDAPRPIHRDRSVALLAAAAVVVVATVGLVLAFGISRPPALEPLGEGGDRPTEGLARITWREDTACLEVFTAGAGPREITCDLDGGEVLGWQDDVIAIRTWSQVGEELLLVGEDGEVRARRRLSPEDAQRLPLAPYAAARTAYRDGVLTVTVAATGTVAWRVEAPTNYRVEANALSADGRWLAMVDSASRLLIVRADGSEPPRVWVEDVGNPWDAIAWEGTGTVPE